MAEAKKSSNTSVVDQIKSSQSMQLLVTLAITLLVAIIFAQLLDSESNAFTQVLILVIFAAVVGVVVRMFSDGGNAASWSAALHAGAGGTFLAALAPRVGYDGAQPFGDAFVASLSPEYAVVSVFALFLAAIALIVLRWGK